MTQVEPKTKPVEWICNACDHSGKTSREHLIHVAIGQVILRDRSLDPDRVRARLRSGHFRDFGLYAEPTEDRRIGSAWMNQTIRGLICVDCNGGWAKTLEEKAGANLYDFIHVRGPANAAILRRWAAFFAIKLWFTNTRTEVLAEAPGHGVLTKVAQPDTSVALPVRVARLPFSDRTWDFAANVRGWAGAQESPYIMWVVRGLVFLVVRSGKPTIQLPIPRSVELTDGLRLHQVPTLRRGQVHPLFTAPPVTGRAESA